MTRRQYPAIGRVVGRQATVPWLTGGLCALALALMALPSAWQQHLYFDRNSGAGALIGQLISGHWIHGDVSHLMWNMVALLVLGATIERYGKGLLCGSLMAGMLAVDALLLSPFSPIQHYCGLSGVLNTLLGVALWLLWRETRSPVVVFVGLLSVAKVIAEVRSGEALLTQTRWPPFPLSHLAGLLAAPWVLLVAGRRSSRWDLPA